jgi:hypothetical protein
MPLFVKQAKSALYVHVPKTGGSSIEQFFAGNGFRSEFLDANPKTSLNRFRLCSPQHMTAEQLLSLLRPTRIDYIFMTVRDPLTRILSEYKMRLRVAQETQSLSQWVTLSFRRFLEDPYTNDNHIRPQADFWIPGCDVFRQEDGFDEIVSRIEARLGLPIEKRDMGSHNTDKGTVLDSDEVARITPLVRQFYRRDYLMFGY